MTELAIGMALCSLLIAAAGAVALVRLHGRLQEKQRVWEDSIDQRFRALEKLVTTTTKGSVGVGQRLVVLEQKLQALAASHENQDQSGDRQAYTQAVQMLDQGADIETVVASCGLSRSEAQLMALVRKQTAPKPAAKPAAKTRERG